MIDGKIRRLKKWQKGGRAGPFSLDINPTDRCNLKCRSCWQRNPKFGEIDSEYQLGRDKLLELIDQAIELDVKRFEITGGGEPLVRKEVVLEIMNKIKKNGRYGNITTNGTLLSKRDLEFITEINWDNVTISLDGPNSEINNYLRGENSFERVMDNIKTLNDLKEAEKPSLKFNTVISNRNYDHLSEIMELAAERKVETVSFETLTVHSDQGEELKLNKEEREELKENIPKIQKKAKSLGIKTNIGSLKQKHFKRSNEMDSLIEGEESFSSIACFEPWYHLVIKVDGSAQPCCLYDSDQENVKNKSLEEIWFGDFFNRVREKIRKENFSEYCKICNASQVVTNKKLREELRTS